MSSPYARPMLSRTISPLVALLILSGPAHASAGPSKSEAASVTARHAAAMDRGLNHEEARVASEAWNATAQAASPAAKHTAAMERGLSHEDAREAAYKSVPDRTASPAAKHAAAMERGLNHEDARVATYAP